MLCSLSIDKNSTPGSRTNRPLFRALKYILSPCIKTLLNVVNDHADNGIFRAVRSADKLIKAHCLPLEWTLNSSSPWWILAERNKAILTWFLREVFVYFASSQIQNKKLANSWELRFCRAHRIVHAHAVQYFSRTLPLSPPRNYDILNMDKREIEISTTHRSRERLGRVNSGETLACQH